MSIFTEDQTNVSENPLADLVGDGKKYKTAEDLARSKLEADRFIDQLKRENEEMRKEVQEKISMDEFMTKVRDGLTPANPPEGSRDTPQNPKPDTPDLEKAIAEAIIKREAYNKNQSNLQKVEQVLSEKWGEQAQTKLNQKARELGVSVDYLKGLATNSPDLFYTAVGIAGTKAAPTVTPPASQRAPQLQTQGGDRGPDYYAQLKANDRKKYFSQEVQMQQYRDMMANPEAFGINIR